MLSHFSACNRTLIADASDTYFTSPNYPNNYPLDSNCEWNIMNYHGDRRLKLDIVDFVTESNFDFVYIYSDGHYSGKLTGSLSNSSSFIADRHMRVVFTSDSTNQKRGFKAYYNNRGNCFIFKKIIFLCNIDYFNHH